MIDKKNSAFCVACGNATCSDTCHQIYEENNVCSFHTNFVKEKELKSLRSLRFDNVFFAEKNNLAVGTILNKTSKSFIYGMKNEKKHHLYLQRGFRQYGNPEENVLEHLIVFNIFGIDYVFNRRRLCFCDCIYCSNRFNHPFISCWNDCKNCDQNILQDFVNVNLKE